jgi:RNA binding exosome subunit
MGINLMDLDSVILGGFRLKKMREIEKIWRTWRENIRKRETREIERKVNDFQGREDPYPNLIVF